jgi:transcription antitermination factor NusG
MIDTGSIQKWIAGDAETPRWYAIRTAPRREFRACSELSSRGMEAYLPSYGNKRQWSDRAKVIEQPLFPGYLFCRFPLADRVRILESPGVRQIVGIGKTPAPIQEHQIDNLRAMVASRHQLAPWPYLNAGQRIHIVRGPLAGVRGFVVRAEEGAVRVVASLDLLQRSVAAVIEREWIGVVG